MLLISAAFALVILVELPGMIRHKLTREMVMFFVLLALAATIVIIEAAGLELPSPMQLARYFLEDVVGLSYSKFH